MSKISILITATIQPGNTPNVAVADYLVREGQYYSALLSYVKLGIPIVFVENSNTNSEKIKTLLLRVPNTEYFTLFQASSPVSGRYTLSDQCYCWWVAPQHCPRPLYLVQQM